MSRRTGILIPIGGGEDKKDKKEILDRFVRETDSRDPIIEVITTATNMPDEVGRDYTRAFEDLSVRRVNIMHIEEREEANSEDIIDRIKNAHGVIFTGGDQLKLSSILGGTEMHKALKDRFENDTHFVIAGTSAGAAAMSNTMIVSGASTDALIKGQLQLTNGLDFINSVFIDTHFTQRGRFGRVIQTVAANPAVLGLGLGEDTGAVIFDNDDLEIIGSGLAVVVDGSEIKYSNLADVAEGEPITVEGVKIHILSAGKRFRISEKKLIRT